MKTLFTFKKKNSWPQLCWNIKVLHGQGSELLSQLLHGNYRNWIMKHPGKSRVPKKPVIHSTASCYFRGVSTITSTHDSEQAWLVNPIFSNSELRNLQEILLTVAMFMGLEIGRTNTETVGVLKQWSPELRHALHLLFNRFSCSLISLGQTSQEPEGPSASTWRSLI